MKIIVYGNIRPFHTETSCCNAIVDVLPTDVCMCDGKFIYTCPVCGQDVLVMPDDIKKAGWDKMSRFTVGGYLNV